MPLFLVVGFWMRCLWGGGYDHDFGSGMAGPEVGKGVGGVVEWVDLIDNRCERFLLHPFTE